MVNVSIDTNYMLTGIAMLTAMWDTGQHDVLDALTPYVRYAIYKETGTGESINPAKIAKRLDDELGYSQFDVSVVEIVLRRLSKSRVLVRKNNKYFIAADLSKEVAQMDGERQDIRRSHERVGKKLADYLNEHYPRKDFDEDTALGALTTFFANSGLLIVQNPRLIESIPKSSDKLLYHVGQFVLCEYDNDSSIFYDIERMVKGFFVSTAIYTRPETKIKEQFKDTTIYLDTHILLCALGILTDEESESKQNLLHMIKEHGARAACFQETYTELIGILNAYKYSLANGFPEGRINTLSGFDKNHMNPAQVEAFIASLQQRLNILGIEVCTSPELDPKIMTRINSDELSASLGSLHYNRDKTLQHDFDCVRSICILRRGHHPATLEKCGSIFITNNPRMMNAANKAVGSNFQNTVQPVMLDTELSAILWLKSYSVHGDYPRIKLIENAAVAMYPSETIMKAFYVEVEKARNDGVINSEVCQALKVGLFQRRELMRMIDGDENNINEDTVAQVADALRSAYSDENKLEITDLRNRLDMSERERNEAKNRALKEIGDAGAKCKEGTMHFGGIVIRSLLILFFIVSCYQITSSFLNQNNHVNILSIFGLIVEILGIIDLFFSNTSVLDKWLERFANYLSDVVKEKKRKKYAQIFGENFDKSDFPVIP